MFSIRNKSKLFLLTQFCLVAATFCLLVFIAGQIDFPKRVVKAQWMPKLEIPKQDEYFYSEPVGDSLSQLVLYHNLGESIEQARQADILFVGNSRLQYGFRETLVQEAAEMGLKVFSLGMGHSERAKFALEIIEKYEIKPKVLVVTGGPFFFKEKYSKVAKEVRGLTAWQARKKYWESQALWRFQKLLHAVVPKLSLRKKTLTKKFVNYRSDQHGWFYPALEPRGEFPVKAGKEKGDYHFVLPEAEKLIRSMATQNTLTVFTLVPYSKTLTGHYALLQSNYSVPVILPDFDGLKTSDSSHLTKDSARIYSSRFWAALMKDESVRERLNSEE